MAIGLEADPLSQWLHKGLTNAGFEAVLLETRQVKSAMKAMPIKTDRRDTEGIARLLRMGWLRPAHCKAVSSREMRALLTSRKSMAETSIKIEISLRVGRTDSSHTDGSALRTGWARKAGSQFGQAGFSMPPVGDHARVGPVVALTFKSAIDDPERFRGLKDVGPWVGPTPGRNQSDERDIAGTITKALTAVSVRRSIRRPP